MKKSFLKRALLLMLVCLMALQGIALADSAVISDKEFTLTLWTFNDYAEMETSPVLRTAIELYKEIYPNATVNVEGKGRPEELYDALSIAMGADSAPDLFFSNLGQVMSFYVKNDKLESLSKYAEQYGWYDAYPSFDYQNGVYGDVFALPQTLNVMGIWYKLDIFEQYGLTVPTTYQELLDTCAKLKENGIVPMVMGGKNPALITRLIDAILEKEGGAEYHDALLAGTASFNDPAIVNTFATYKRDWVDTGYFQEGFLSAEETETYMLWYPSKACFLISGNWEIANIINNGMELSDYGFCAIPTDTDRRLITFGDGYFMSKSSELKDEAAAFLNCISTLEAQKSYQEQFGDSSVARLGAIDTANVSAVKSMMLDAIAGTGSFVPTNEIGLDPKMTDVWFECIDQVSMGEMTPEEAAVRLDERATEYGWYVK